jgi:hypothetical protein
MSAADGPGPAPEFHPEGSVQVWANQEDFVWYTQDDFDSMYADNNIVNFAIQPDPLRLANIDEETLTLYYQSGEEYSLQLGSITDLGIPDEKYFLAGSVLITPADASLAPRFNFVTTPNLWNLRNALNALVQQLNDQRIEIGSIDYSFAKMMQAAGNMDLSPIIDDLRNSQTTSAAGSTN